MAKKNRRKITLRKRKKSNNIRFSIGTLLLVALMILFLILSTFVQLDVQFFKLDFKYIPQIPVVLFIAGLLGRKYGLLSIICYILLGLLVLPIFALGGGIKYVIEYGFGYVLAYLPALFLASGILKNSCSYKNILKASIVGVLSIHLIGVLYMLFVASLKMNGYNFIGSWIVAQSGIKILYDIIYSVFALMIVRFIRPMLWFYK
ncbi:MAG: biotin transporter BioY [Candidatus Gastranaerophilales bacterium]